MKGPMKGKFLTRKPGFWDFLLVIGGLLSIGFYVFLKITAPEEASEMLFFLILGIVMLLNFVLLLLLTSNGHIDVDEDAIKARYSCFWKIDCRLSEVSYAEVRGNSLIILLKNGDTHTIMNLANAWVLASYIRKNMPPEEAEQTDVLIERWQELKRTRKKWLIFICFGFALMILGIFVTVLLTGERELHEFGKADWILFSVMGAAESAMLIAAFCFAAKAGKKVLPLRKCTTPSGKGS